MSKNAYMNLNIRVCGDETLVLADQTTKFFINGVVEGDPSAMTDAVRYFTINEATFASYFVLGLNNDPCIVNHYSIYTSITPEVPWNPYFALLTGSLGNHELKFDLTIPHNTVKIFLKAQTRGLVHIYQ